MCKLVCMQPELAILLRNMETRYVLSVSFFMFDSLATIGFHWVKFCPSVKLKNSYVN